jgi:hypothetical protein
MTRSALQKMSESDYLWTEESSPFRREYIDGFVYALHADDSPNAQAGALSKHGVICANLIATLHRPALPQVCRVQASEMWPAICGSGCRRWARILTTPMFC